MNIKDIPFSERYYKQETLKYLAKQLNYYYRKFGLGKEKLMDATKWTPRLVQNVFKDERTAETYINDLEIDSKYRGIDITKAVRGKSVSNEMKSINKDIASYLRTYNKYADTKLSMKEFREKAGMAKTAYYMAENAKLKAELNKYKTQAQTVNKELVNKIQEAIDKKIDNSSELSRVIKEKNQIKRELERYIEKEKVENKKIYENKIFNNIKAYQDKSKKTIEWYLENNDVPAKKMSKFNTDLKYLNNNLGKMLNEIAELNGEQIEDSQNILELERYSEINSLFKLLKSAIRLNAKDDFMNKSIEEQLDEINSISNIYSEEQLDKLKESLKNIGETNIINYVKNVLFDSPDDLIKKVNQNKSINEAVSKGVVEDVSYSEGAASTVADSDFVCVMNSSWNVQIKYKDLKISNRRTNELLKNFQKETGSSFNDDRLSKYSMFYKWLLNNYQTLLVNQANNNIFNSVKDQCRQIVLPDSVGERKIDLNGYLNNYQKNKTTNQNNTSNTNRQNNTNNQDVENILESIFKNLK